MSEFSLECIENMRIHELRDYARRIGVSSPTTMRKDELIERISKIVELSTIDSSNDMLIGREDKLDFFALLSSSNESVFKALLDKSTTAQTIETSKNKEVKMSKSSNTIVMKKENHANDSYENINRNLVTFSFNVNQNLPEYGDNQDDIVKGYAYVLPDKYAIVLRDGFLPSSRDVYLTETTVNKYHIKSGDIVTGKARIVMNDKPKVMYEIMSIDGSNDKRKSNFDNFSYNPVGESLYLDKFNLDIKKGERVYIENMTLDDAVKLGYDIVEENSASVKFLNIKARPEENYQSNQKFEIINCQFNKEEKDVVLSLELVMERIKRQFENRKSNVLIVYNFSELIRIVNAHFQGVYDFNKFSAQAVNKIHNVLSMAKCFDNNLYTTVVCINKSGVTTDMHNLIETELKPIFNRVLENVQPK
ncbi:MAG: hypothetical protein E7345_02130 [Clostridiales bacterium]|nr:hypothetical protein [Clostridiales bacterium]